MHCIPLRRRIFFPFPERRAGCWIISCWCGSFGQSKSVCIIFHTLAFPKTLNLGASISFYGSQVGEHHLNTLNVVETSGNRILPAFSNEKLIQMEAIGRAKWKSGEYPQVTPYAFWTLFNLCAYNYEVGLFLIPVWIWINWKPTYMIMRVRTLEQIVSAI